MIPSIQICFLATQSNTKICDTAPLRARRQGDTALAGVNTSCYVIICSTSAKKLVIEGCFQFVYLFIPVLLWQMTEMSMFTLCSVKLSKLCVCMKLQNCFALFSSVY